MSQILLNILSFLFIVPFWRCYSMCTLRSKVRKRCTVILAKYILHLFLLLLLLKFIIILKEFSIGIFQLVQATPGKERHRNILLLCECDSIPELKIQMIAVLFILSLLLFQFNSSVQTIHLNLQTLVLSLDLLLVSELGLQSAPILLQFFTPAERVIRHVGSFFHVCRETVSGVPHLSCRFRFMFSASSSLLWACFNSSQSFIIWAFRFWTSPLDWQEQHPRQNNVLVQTVQGVWTDQISSLKAWCMLVTFSVAQGRDVCVPPSLWSTFFCNSAILTTQKSVKEAFPVK